MAEQIPGQQPVDIRIPGASSRTLVKIKQVSFPGGIFEAGGANSKIFLQSRSRRWLFLDEVRNWKRWALPMVLKRISMWRNSRVMIATTPATVDDPAHREFKKGTQEHYHVECPHCHRRVAELTFQCKRGEQINPHYVAEHDGGMRWDSNDVTRPGGLWDFDAMAKTIRYVWPCCGGISRDTPDERQRIAEQGEWIAYNPRAPADRVSATWSAMLPPKGRTWASIVEEYITAVHALKTGDFEPYKAFITETLGQPWEERHRAPPDDTALDACKEDYDPLMPWEEEARRLLVFDVQEKGMRYRWLVCGFTSSGESRRFGAGECSTKEDLEWIRLAFNVASADVICDTGHDTTEVYKMLLASGTFPLTGTVWKGMKGERAAHYIVGKIQQPYRFSEWIDPYYGTPDQGSSRLLRVILFSKSQLLDRLAYCQKGFGAGWKIPRQFKAPPGMPGRMLTIEEYISQVTAYELVEETDSRGVTTRKWHQRRKDDHCTSLEMMALVAAMATGLFVTLPPQLSRPPQAEPEEAIDEAEDPARP